MNIEDWLSPEEASEVWRHFERRFTFNGVVFEVNDKIENLRKLKTLDINATMYNNSESLLFSVTSALHFYMMKYLVEHGALLNTKTAFQAIESTEVIKVLEYLIDNGAIVYKRCVPCECCVARKAFELLWTTHQLQRKQWNELLIELLGKKFLGPEVIEYIVSDEFEQEWCNE